MQQTPECHEEYGRKHILPPALKLAKLIPPKVYVFLVLGAIAICNKRVISPVTILEGGLAAES